MDRQFQGKGERAISAVLRYGSLISTLVMAVGSVLWLVTRGSVPGSSHHGIHPALLIPALIRLQPAAIIELGVLLLLLTPIFRIVVALLSFAFERDFKYVLISLGVLAVVLFSIGFAVET
jgi:uncharacterized membrane protein